MVETRWINGIFILLLSEAWSRDTGTSRSTSVRPNVSNSPPTVSRHAAFNLGKDANVTCSNKTWNEILYVIWNINLKHSGKSCKISFSDGGQKVQSCNDGKSLRNTTRAQSYLHIPHFSNSDEGLYSCEVAFQGGAEFHKVTVAATVPPNTFARIDSIDNKKVAMCVAENGKPAASLSWNHPGNSTSEETKSDGFVTVVSRLELTEEMDIKHLKCAISHPYWDVEKQIPISEPSKGFNILVIVCISIVTAVALAVFLFCAQTKLTKIKRDQRSDTSASKPAPDVEEVEPYASYVQRVNSIYNSSIDLFS